MELALIIVMGVNGLDARFIPDQLKIKGYLQGKA
jgi:hypothetical protein